MKKVISLFLVLIFLIVTISALADTYSPGDTILLGSYEQDNNPSNGKEPIEWIILIITESSEKYIDRTETKSNMLLLSKYALDSKPFNKSKGKTTWEKCSLRKWLNDDFYKNAFAEDEKEKILLTKNNNNVGNTTEDYVFLLSSDELEDVFPKEEMRIALNTSYAVANGAHVNDNKSSWWWLRSSGAKTTTYSCAVGASGAINFDGTQVHAKDRTARPSLWVSINHIESQNNTAIMPEFTAGNYVYIIDEENGTATITKYTGSEKEIQIPEEINGYQISGIGEEAFRHCSATCIILPEGLTTIYDNAFYDCKNLTSVQFPSTLETIGQGAFSTDTKLKELDIPEGVKTIEKNAFYDCSSLGNVILPDSIEYIGSYAFGKASKKLMLLIGENNYIIQYAKEYGLKYEVR